MSEIKRFKAMLKRAGIGHGTREDYDGEAVMVTPMHGEGDHCMEFKFDDDGRLESVMTYEIEED